MINHKSKSNMIIVKDSKRADTRLDDAHGTRARGYYAWLSNTTTRSQNYFIM